MHDCKNIDTFIPGKMGKFLEKSGNFVSEKKWDRAPYRNQGRQEKPDTTQIPIYHQRGQQTPT